MATAYHRDQAGAPALTFTTASTGVNHFTNLKNILKACLVSGFGSQPAAGWELIAEGTNYIVLRNGSHTGYVCFTHISTGKIYSAVSYTFTGMSGDYMTGDGYKSGAAANSTVPQKFDIQYAQYNTNTSSWFVVADSKTFVLSLSSIASATATELTSTGGNLGSLWYVGEDSNGWFVVIGGENTTAAGPGQWFSTSGITLLRNPATGLLVGADVIAASTPALGDQAQTFSINAVFPEIEMARLPWIGGGAYAGKLRGLALPSVLARHMGAYAAYCMGVVSYNSRNANTPIPFGDSYTWFLAWKTTSSAQLMMTNNPDYW